MYLAVVQAVVQFWNKWGFRITVLSSLAANLLLGLLSWTRRRSVSGWRRSILKLLAAFIIWLAYQVADKATTSALGSLSLSDDCDASADEKQVVAFWAPFLLLHLGGPDNMTAYSLEDNKLSLRKAVDLVAQVLSVIYLIFVRYPCSGALFAASFIVLGVGAARFVERMCALWGANLDNLCPDDEDCNKKQQQADEQLGGELDDRQALLVAQEGIRATLRALVDSSVERGSDNILSLGWKSLCKVVEMEFSLMYEALYTKAMVAHTWPGYLLRFISPVATASAASLFWLWLHCGFRVIRPSFVNITYLLLAAAFTLDVVWLLRALGSTWTYAFLKARPQWAWLHHHVLCAGRWRCLHRAVVYLDPLRLLFGTDPISSRRWSGTIGRYNLLHECTSTTATTRRRGPCSAFYRWLATKSGLEETRYLCQLPRDVRELLFQRVQRVLPMPNNSRRVDTYSRAAITSCWGQEALRKDKALLFPGIPDDELPKFGKVFEQDVLAWHIATSIFLSRAKVRKLAKSSTHVAAIEAMSEYLMFLVAQRRQMLPGLVLHRLLEVTRRALDEIWNVEGKRTSSVGRNKEKLATILRRKRIENQDWAKEDKRKQLPADAVVIAAALTKSSMQQQRVPRMLEFIFKVWVDKLLYAGVTCSRESHAQQLSRGGELTTILWLTTQHAGPFLIGERNKEKEEEEMKKEEEEKEEEDSTPVPVCPPQKPCPCPCSCPSTCPPPLPCPCPCSCPYPYPPSSLCPPTCSYPHPSLCPPTWLPTCSYPHPSLCPPTCPYPPPPPCPPQAQPPCVLGWWPPYETPMSDTEETEEHEVPPLKEEEPERAKEPEMPIIDDEDPIDAEEYKIPIKYITLY